MVALSQKTIMDRHLAAKFQGSAQRSAMSSELVSAALPEYLLKFDAVAKWHRLNVHRVESFHLFCLTSAMSQPETVLFQIRTVTLDSKHFADLRHHRLERIPRYHLPSGIFSSQQSDFGALSSWGRGRKRMVDCCALGLVACWRMWLSHAQEMLGSNLPPFHMEKCLRLKLDSLPSLHVLYLGAPSSVQTPCCCTYKSRRTSFEPS